MINEHVMYVYVTKVPAALLLISCIALMASHSESPLVTLPEENPATHAGRHPSQPQQKTRVLTQHSLSLAQKATRALRQISDHAKAEELSTALDVLLSRHHTELEDFAKEHDTKPEYIQKLTSQSSHYKQKRAVTIQNAKLHAKSLEINRGTHTIYENQDITFTIFQKTFNPEKKSSQQSFVSWSLMTLPTRTLP